MNITILTSSVGFNPLFRPPGLITLKIHAIHTFQTHADIYWQGPVIISVFEIVSLEYSFHLWDLTLVIDNKGNQ